MAFIINVKEKQNDTRYVCEMVLLVKDLLIFSFVRSANLKHTFNSQKERGCENFEMKL
jgi:hypothetical protein